MLMFSKAQKALGTVDGPVVDRCLTALHQAVGREFPEFVAVRAIPLAVFVVPLVEKPHGDAVVGKTPQLFFQPIIEFSGPFALQKFADGIAALEELVATLRSHLTRLTTELSSHQAFLAELRALRESDQQAMHTKLAEVDVLKAEVERLAGEVEVLRGVVEEGLRERRRAKEISNLSVIPEESYRTSTQENASDHRVAEDDSGIGLMPERSSTPPSRQTTPRPPRQQHQHQRQVPDRTTRTDHATMGSTVPANMDSVRFVDDEEIERLSEELEERRSELSRSSAASSSAGEASVEHVPAQNVQPGTPATRNASTRAQAPTSRVGTERRSPRGEIPETPFPQIRGERLERLFFSAPEHDVKKCALCHRRRQSNNTTWDPRTKKSRARTDVQPKDAQERDGDERFEKEEEPEEPVQKESDDDDHLPPQTVLARVLRELEDDFTHYKG